MRPIVILQHGEDDPPGNVGRFLDEVHCPWQVRRPFLGEQLPATPGEFAGLIVLGGNMHPHQEAENPFLVPEKALLRAALEADVPVLGICLGGQLLSEAAGGRVYVRDQDETGWVSIDIVGDDELFSGIASPFMAFEWHTYSFTLPPGGVLLAERPDGVQSFRIGRAWGLQFHPEARQATILRWIDEEEAMLERRSPELPARLRAQTPALIDEYESFCARLVGNWLRAAGLAIGAV